MLDGKIKNNGGSILVFALWSLALLTFLAVQIGLTVRQKIVLISRLETRSQLHFLAEAGAKKAIALLAKDLQAHKDQYTPEVKSFRHNNPEEFSGISVGQGTVDVSYRDSDGGAPDSQIRYGVVDEESKININFADRAMLTRLIENLPLFKEDQAKEVATAIVDWRELVGQSETTGFYSDDYYSNLKDPYEPKHGLYESIDELLLVKGVTPEVYNRLRPYLTIYGNGLVNINTASAPVLVALGLNRALADKLLMFRRGPDGLEATTDDFIFQKTFDMASDMSKLIKLDAEEIGQLDALNASRKIKIDSLFFLIRSQGRLANRNEASEVICVYNGEKNWLEFWREK